MFWVEKEWNRKTKIKWAHRLLEWMFNSYLKTSSVFVSTEKLNMKCSTTFVLLPKLLYNTNTNTHFRCVFVWMLLSFALVRLFISGIFGLHFTKKPFHSNQSVYTNEKVHKRWVNNKNKFRLRPKQDQLWLHFANRSLIFFFFCFLFQFSSIWNNVLSQKSDKNACGI